jgi:predicted deacylase
MPRRLEVAPDVYIRAGKNGKLQQSGVRKDGWSLRKRAMFLDHLAATCNVRASEAAAGIRQGGAYPLRRRDSDFAAAWDEALEIGYVRLEAMVIERTIKKIEIPEGTTTAPDISATDIEQAFTLLRLHGRSVKEYKRRGGGKAVQATEAETNAAIIKKLRALNKRLALIGD